MPLETLWWPHPLGALPMVWDRLVWPALMREARTTTAAAESGYIKLVCTQFQLASVGRSPNSPLLKKPSHAPTLLNCFVM